LLFILTLNRCKSETSNQRCCLWRC